MDRICLKNVQDPGKYDKMEWITEQTDDSERRRKE